MSGTTRKTSTPDSTKHEKLDPKSTEINKDHLIDPKKFGSCCEAYQVVKTQNILKT